MSDRADFNRDGVIRLNELEWYATIRGRRLSRGGQDPTAIRPFPVAEP